MIAVQREEQTACARDVQQTQVRRAPTAYAALPGQAGEQGTAAGPRGLARNGLLELGPMGFFSKLLGITAKQQPVHLDDTNFTSEVLKSELPVLIDVWGQKCSHCKRLEPVMMEL